MLITDPRGTRLQGYREDDGLLLESDTDEQILIHIPFQQAARLTGIIIKSSAADGHAPKNIKLFVNQPTIGFGGTYFGMFQVMHVCTLISPNAMHQCRGI